MEAPTIIALSILAGSLLALILCLLMWRIAP